MSTKTFCDMCERQITDATASHGGTVGRLGATLRRGDKVMQVEVITAKESTWNAGDFCKYCVIDALNELDDRPRAAQAA